MSRRFGIVQTGRYSIGFKNANLTHHWTIDSLSDLSKHRKLLSPGCKETRGRTNEHQAARCHFSVLSRAVDSTPWQCLGSAPVRRHPSTKLHNLYPAVSTDCLSSQFSILSSASKNSAFAHTRLSLAPLEVVARQCRPPPLFSLRRRSPSGAGRLPPGFLLRIGLRRRRTASVAASASAAARRARTHACTSVPADNWAAFWLM